MFLYFAVMMAFYSILGSMEVIMHSLVSIFIFLSFATMMAHVSILRSFYGGYYALVSAFCHVDGPLLRTWCLPYGAWRTSKSSIAYFLRFVRASKRLM